MKLVSNISMLFVFAILATQSLNAKIEFKIQDNRQLVAVIDAGSSGSRLYIFQYQDNPQAGQNRVVEIVNFKVEPGISNFGNNLGGLGAYFTELVEGTKKKLAGYNSAHQTSLSLDGMPVFLLATAGMRNLLENDRTNILGAVTAALRNSELKFEDAKTITGVDEAIFAWTAANFNQPVSKTLGIVEIGGASAQVVFPFAGTNSHAVTINLAGKDYKLYAYSYPTHGENEAIARIKKGASSKFEEYCATMTSTKRSSSTFDQCVDLIVDSLKTDCDNKGICQFGWSNEATQPSVNGDTPFTFAGVIRATKNDFVNTKAGQIPLTQSSLKDAGIFACQMTTNDIVAEKAITDPRFANNACFQSALSYVMLFGNEGIPNVKEVFRGVGLPAAVTLKDSPAPGPAWPMGFVLFHEADGRITK